MAHVLGSPQDILATATSSGSFIRRWNAATTPARRVCVPVPDATRGCRLPALFDGVHATLHGRGR
jgi:lactate racemase